MIDWEKKYAELLVIVANALVALEEGRRGDCRRILTTGNDKPILATTGVLTNGRQ